MRGQPDQARGGSGWRTHGFTLVELMVVIAVLALLAGLLAPYLARAQGRGQRVRCLNNVRQFVAADLMHLGDEGQLPASSETVPSSIRVERLAGLAHYLGMPVPAGPAYTWPKRARQPAWINCPSALDSGLAEGVTLGGGLYTGYAYYGGLEESALVARGLATVVNPGHAATLRNTQRGVLWADVLDEYRISEARRFEFFHRRGRARHRDFRQHVDELEGIHRGWSDGSAEWLPGERIQLTGDRSPDLRLRHTLGNFYF